MILRTTINGTTGWTKFTPTPQDCGEHISQICDGCVSRWYVQGPIIADVDTISFQGKYTRTDAGTSEPQTIAEGYITLRMPRGDVYALRLSWLTEVQT